MNFLAQMMNLARSGGNPMAVMGQMAQNNPQVAQVMRMTQGKTVSEMETMARNMCRERGTTPEQILQQFGISPPFGGMQ